MRHLWRALTTVGALLAVYVLLGGPADPAQ